MCIRDRDQVIRHIRQLEIEKVALEKETDDASAERLDRLEAELANLAEQRDGITAHWQQEKAAIDAIRALKERQTVRGDDAVRLEREGDLAGASAIRYGELPDIERRIAASTSDLSKLQEENNFLKEEVDDEDIAEVVSSRTGEKEGRE